MAEYDYKEGKKRIIDILNSKEEIYTLTNIPKDDKQFTYINGIKSWVGAIFVDIVNSSSLFKEEKEEKVARMIRAFCSEIIEILRKNEKYIEIGIRGDCVYAIYTVPKQDDLNSVFEDAIMINTFQKMYKKILSQNNFPTFDIGIGLGASEDLIVKAGKAGTGIYDKVWIGSAVVNASKLSSEANRSINNSILMDGTFFGNIKNYMANENYNYLHYSTKKYSEKIKEYVYAFDMVYTNYDKWIDKGM